MGSSQKSGSLRAVSVWVRPAWVGSDQAPLSLDLLAGVFLVSASKEVFIGEEFACHHPRKDATSTEPLLMPRVRMLPIENRAVLLPAVVLPDAEGLCGWHGGQMAIPPFHQTRFGCSTVSPLPPKLELECWVNFFAIPCLCSRRSELGNEMFFPWPRLVVAC